jgi:pimeloyl-ACP methyl ester carboxylesterase
MARTVQHSTLVNTMPEVHTQEWGAGDPVIALHPLALESTAFAGLGEDLAREDLRTIAVDLPGFGASEAPPVSLTPAVLAAPVIELARSLEKPPLVVGMSMGGRVALEMAVSAPDAIRGVVLIAPYLPWRNYRWALPAARMLDPTWSDKLPLEKMWPVLKRVATFLDELPAFEHDWIARAAARVVYYGSCPATRHAFLSAARELALDPAFGPDGLWTRMAHIEMPTTFVWGGRDGLIPSTHADDVADVQPGADQVEVACAAHFVSGPHFRCMRRAARLAVLRTLEAERDGAMRGLRILSRCVADVVERDDESNDIAAAPTAGAAGGTR